MKRVTIVNFLILGLVLVVGATGCKKKPAGITHIPGSRPVLGTGGTSGLEDGSGRLPGGFTPDEINDVSAL